MTLTQIHALLAVLEYGGFTEASKRLYMTQSAVSQAISALEEELGVDILIRERRKEIELTAAGSRIVRHLRAIQRDVNAVKEIAEQEKEPGPYATDWLFSSACACILPGVIRYFESHHPNVKIIPMKRTVRLLLIRCRTEVLMPVSFLFRSTVCIASPFTGINSP